MVAYTDPKQYAAALNKWKSYTGNQNWTNPQMGAGAMPTFTAPPKPAATTATTTSGTTAAAAAPKISAAAQAQLDRRNAVNKAVAGGGTWLNTHIKDLGLTNPKDIADITARFNEALGGVAGNIPAGAATVPSFYNYSDLLNKATTAETGQQRADLNAAYQKATPYGWQDKYFGETSDDPILQGVLGQQAGELRDTLDRKLARGQMTQGAYDYAVNQLGYNPGSTDYSGLSSSAYSTLQGIGGGVLGGYKTGLGDIASDFKNQVTNFQLGDVVDPNVFNTNVQNKVGQYQSGMEGDIMKALGSTQLFDPNALFAKAGGAAGPNNAPIAGGNPQGTGVLTGEEDKRNVGTTGPF